MAPWGDHYVGLEFCAEVEKTSPTFVVEVSDFNHIQAFKISHILNLCACEATNFFYL
jgi:hypothetical protein